MNNILVSTNNYARYEGLSKKAKSTSRKIVFSIRKFIKDTLFLTLILAEAIFLLLALYEVPKDQLLSRIEIKYENSDVSILTKGDVSILRIDFVTEDKSINEYTKMSAEEYSEYSYMLPSVEEKAILKITFKYNGRNYICNEKITKNLSFFRAYEFTICSIEEESMIARETDEKSY